MKKSSKEIFLLKNKEIETSLEKEYRQYFIGSLEKPQMLDHLEQGDFEFGTSFYKKAKADVPHMHSKTSEILYVLQGIYRILDIEKNEEYVLTQGDFFVLPPNTPYASKAVDNTRVLFVKTGGNDKINIEITDSVRKWVEIL